MHGGEIGARSGGEGLGSTFTVRLPLEGGRLAVPDMTTTVLTLTLTGLAADSSLAGGGNPRAGRRVASVLFIFAGAAVGALLLRHSLALPLVLSGACVLTASGVYAARGRVLSKEIR